MTVWGGVEGKSLKMPEMTLGQKRKENMKKKNKTLRYMRLLSKDGE